MLLACISGFLPLPAQNLVLNPSFETISSCPLGPSELDNAANWSNPFQNLIGDTCSTSDLYNACNPLGAFGTDVPANILGNEPARTGDGYAGIILSERISIFGCTSFGGSNWREYVHGQLSTPLTAGQTYCVTFYASLADAVKYASDDFGVLFSNNALSVSCASLSGNGPLPFSPQLQWTGGIVTSATGWTQLQWSYTASGGEQFITIGNFNDDANTTISCVNANGFNPYAYYYIDDVSVVPGPCAVLPVELAYFKGEAKDGGNEVHWETREERGNSHFEVERSKDGVEWEMVDRIRSEEKGYGKYSTVDRFPHADTWYRLSQTDLDGQRQLLETILVQRAAFSNTQLQDLFPSPARTSLHFVFEAPAGPLSATVLDLHGRSLLRLDFQHPGGRAQYDLPVDQLPNGIFRLHLTGSTCSENHAIRIAR